MAVKIRIANSQGDVFMAGTVSRDDRGRWWVEDEDDPHAGLLTLTELLEDARTWERENP